MRKIFIQLLGGQLKDENWHIGEFWVANDFAINCRFRKFLEIISHILKEKKALRMDKKNNYLKERRINKLHSLGFIVSMIEDEIHMSRGGAHVPMSVIENSSDNDWAEILKQMPAEIENRSIKPIGKLVTK